MPTCRRALSVAARCAGRFTISFWFTHNYCTDEAVTGSWETLFTVAGQFCDEAHADGCEPQEIWIGLRCHADTPLVGVNGTVLRLIMRDDLGQMVQTDLAVGREDTPDRSGGLVTKSWVHYALVVDGDTVPRKPLFSSVHARC